MLKNYDLSNNSKSDTEIGWSCMWVGHSGLPKTRIYARICIFLNTAEYLWKYF